MDKVQAGKIFAFSSGEYSSYSVNGIFLALVDLTTEMFQSVVDEIKNEVRSGTVKDCLGDAIVDKYDVQTYIEEQFKGRLIRRGVIVDIDYTEIHTGAYGKLEISGVETE